MTQEEIRKLAELARVEVEPTAEAPKLAKDVSAILGYVAKVKEGAAAAEGADEGLGPTDVLRDDGEPLPRRLETEKLVASAAQSQSGYVKVQKVL